MKNTRWNWLTLFLLFFIVLSPLGFVNAAPQAPYLQWSQTYYGDHGRAIQTADGGYAIACNNASILFYPASERAPTMIKTDSSGEIEWKKTFDATGLLGINSIIQTRDLGYVLSGTNIAQLYSPTTQNYVYSGWLLKTDDKSTVQWNKTFGLPFETCSTIQENDGSGYTVAGYSTNSANGDDSTLIKIDNSGNLLWSKTFGGNSSRLFAMSLIEANDGGCIIVGGLDGDGWLAKTDAADNLQWSKTFHPNSAPTFFFDSASKTNDGGYILAGGGSNSGWLIKTDSEGNVKWQNSYPVSMLVDSVVQTLDGEYVIGASYNGQACLIITDTSGGLQYSVLYGDVGANVSSFAGSVVLTNDGGYTVSGALNYYSPTTPEGFNVTPAVGKNVWLAKFAPGFAEITPSPSVPELPTWIILPLTAISVFLAILVSKKKRNPLTNQDRWMQKGLEQAKPNL